MKHPLDIIKAIEFKMKAELNELFEQEKKLALEKLEKNLEDKKAEIITRLAISISQSMNAVSNDREIIIRLRS